MSGDLTSPFLLILAGVRFILEKTEGSEEREHNYNEPDKTSEQAVENGDTVGEGKRVDGEEAKEGGFHVELE